jgi:hypothetical protein
MDKVLTELKGFVSVLGKPFHLLTAIMFVVTTVVLYLTYTHKVFEKEYMNYTLLGVEFVILMGLTVVISFKANDFDAKAMERGKESLKELEDHKSMLATNLEKEKAVLEKDKEREVVIGEVTQKIREWITNPPQETQKRKYPFNYGVELEYKVTPTGIKSAILHVEGRPPERYRLN